MKQKNSKSKLLLLIQKLKRKNISITLKLFLSFSFILTCMILLSYINFNLYKKDRDATTIVDLTQLNNQAVSKIDEYFKNQRSYTKLPLFSDQSNNRFFTEYDNFNKLNTPSFLLKNYTDWIATKTIDSNLSTHSVFFYNFKGNSLAYFNGGSFNFYYNPIHEAWFQKVIKSHGKSITISTFNLPGVALYYGKFSYVFSTARAIVNPIDFHIVGVMLINNKLSVLSDLCKQTVTVPKQRILIVDESGHTIYDMNEVNITKLVDPSIYKCITTVPSSSIYVKINGVDYLLCYNTSKETNWRIINLVPIKELNKRIDKMKISTTVITILLILLAFIIILLISRQIVQPIKKLCQLMKIVEKGDFNINIDIRSRDEIGQLARTFNNMTNQINKLINEVYVDKVQRKELELQMLQYQINPHFLYNTLESIQMMALVNNDEETSEMAYALGKILRYGISKKHEIVTVKEELSNLSDYTMLMKVRFDDIYKIIIDIDPELYNYKIIKLILQPIVENSINHGLKDKAHGGIINISGRLIDNTIEFQVTDNGIGMENAQILRLIEYLNDLNDSFTSIGLKNINKRIKLRYGDPYGIYISSELNIGTTVTIILPVED